MMNPIQGILHLLAELEAMFFFYPGAWLPWRRLELRSFGVRFGKHVSVGRHMYIQHSGDIQFGERVALGHNVQIINYAPLEIGDDFVGSNDMIINNGTHNPQTMMPASAPVKIGNRVWIGTRVTILGGVTIGDDVVIGAGSLVTSDIPSNSIAMGSPAKVIRELDRSQVDRFWTWVPPGWMRLH